VHVEIGKGILLGPFGLVLLCQSSVAAYLGARLSDGLVAAFSPVVSVTQARRAFDPFAAEVEPSAALVVAGVSSDYDDGTLASDSEDAVGVSRTQRESVTAKRGVKGSSSTKPLPSVRITQSVVLRLAQRGLRPSGTPVAASGSRPAGIQVFGVGSLGVGVRDGDVLTHVSDVPVTHVGQVIAMVIAARGARKPVITGRLWRGQRWYAVVVEQPYLRTVDEKPASQSASTQDERVTARVHLDGE
jgi:hypothetical protein